MKGRALLLLAVGFALAAGDPKDDPTQNAMKGLQGTWMPVSVESGGVKATGEQLKKVAGKLKIERDTISLEVRSTPINATIKVDPAKRPKTMDLVKDGKTSCLAIYELEGDRLRLCFQVEDGKPRPGEFTSKDAFVIFDYKRNKP